ncbi:hypothetical protein D3C85_1209590 [compost metagenome]
MFLVTTGILFFLGNEIVNSCLILRFVALRIQILDEKSPKKNVCKELEHLYSKALQVCTESVQKASCLRDEQINRDVSAQFYFCC